MWAEFVVGYLLCFVFPFITLPSYFGLSLSSKANISMLQFDLDSVLERIALGDGAASNSNYLNLILYFFLKCT